MQKLVSAELLGCCLQLSFYHVTGVGNTPPCQSSKATGHENAEVADILNRAWGDETAPRTLRQEIRVEVCDNPRHIADPRRKQARRQSLYTLRPGYFDRAVERMPVLGAAVAAEAQVGCGLTSLDLHSTFDQFGSVDYRRGNDARNGAGAEALLVGEVLLRPHAHHVLAHLVGAEHDSVAGDDGCDGCRSTLKETPNSFIPQRPPKHMRDGAAFCLLPHFDQTFRKTIKFQACALTRMGSRCRWR